MPSVNFKEIESQTVELWLPGRPTSKKNKRIRSRVTGRWINPADVYEQVLRDHVALQLQKLDFPIFSNQRLGVALDAFIELSPDARQLPDIANIPEAILDAMQEKRSFDRKAVIRHPILYTDDRQIDFLLIRRFLRTGEKEGVRMICWEL